MQEQADWMKAFLAQRGLTRPNREMLFAYRTSKDEYQSLRALLATKLMQLNGSSWTFSRASECALFVLYAAEWWRREYAGGTWRWLDILKSIGDAPVDLDPTVRTQAVERGLKAWGHRPSDDGKKYLGAIVAQGGLPLKLVASGDGAVTRLLIRGTRQAQLFAWDSTRLESFFKEHEQELVPHLREDAIYRLFASIVSTVVALRDECRLAGESDPIAALNRNLPKWRDRFPIAVDDESAEPLLMGLVKEAARLVKPLTAFPMYFRRVLRKNGASFELSASLAIPATIALSSLAKVCNMNVESIPQSFSLELRSARQETAYVVCDGRQLLGGAEATVMLAVRPKRMTGDAAIHEYLMVMRYVGEDLHDPVGVPGAESLDDALPWVFALRDTEMIFTAVGACRIPDETAFVLVAENTQVEMVDAGSFVERKGITVVLGVPRIVYQISGSVQVTLDDAEVFRIRTCQPVEATDQLVWHGGRLHYASSPLPIFLGVPRLHRYAPDGQITTIHPGDIEWVQPERKGRRIENIRQHRGPADAWLLKDGARQRRFRMALESPDARIQFKSGSSERLGQIEFHDWSLEAVAVSDSLLVQQMASTDKLDLHLQAPVLPPASVRVTVGWQNCAIPLHFDLPFPASGGRFYGINNEPLDNNLSLPFSRLSEIRARVFDRNPNAPKNYSVHMALKGLHGSLKGASVNAEYRIPVNQEGVGELRLLDIESNLQGFQSQCDDLDACIELSLCAGRNAIRKIRLQRYDVQLQQQLLSMRLQEEYLDTSSQDALTSIQLHALPLLFLDAQPVDLIQEQDASDASDASDSAGVGHWPLDALTTEQGPWLVYAAQTSRIQVRPTLYLGSPVAEEFHSQVQTERRSTLCPLGQAMAIEKSIDRIPAIDAVIASMASDYEHESWRLLVQHSQTLIHLPLSTLDAFRAIARSPSAIVAVILKLPVDIPRQMQRMSNELGVVWELIPRSTLAQALKLLSKSWALQFKLDTVDATVQMIVGSIFRSLGQNFGVFSEVIDVVLFREGYNRSPKFDQLIAEMRIGSLALVRNLWQGQDSLLQRILLRAHAQDTRIWPHFKLLGRLIEAVKEALPPDVWLELEKLGRDLLWIQHIDCHTDVANVPFLLGIWSYFCSNVDWLQQEGRVAQLRQIRLFDPAWFEVGFRSGLLVSLAIEHELAAQRVSYAKVRRVISPKR